MIPTRRVTIVNVLADQVVVPDYMKKVPLDEKKVTELEESILMARGMVEPIVVRKEGDQFVLVVGRHRLEACRRARLGTIEAKVVEPLTKREAVRWFFHENLYRRHLSAMEFAYWLDQAMKAMRLSVRGVAAHAGLDEKAVYH